MLNQVTVAGRLTKKVELKTTENGNSVASFSLACERDFKGKEESEKQTDFIDCVAWRNNAEFLSKYFDKGSMAIVTGRIQVRDYQDKDGNKRRKTEVIADKIYFGESKRSASSTLADTSAHNETASQSIPDFDSVNDNPYEDDCGELPF